jgi:hypothetical protein
MPDDLARIVDSLGERSNNPRLGLTVLLPRNMVVSKAIGVPHKLRNERGEYAAANALR